jgi:hypothetical protein
MAVDATRHYVPIADASAAGAGTIEQSVAIGGASVQSAAFNTTTTIIRVHTDAICAIKVGANPTAIAAGATGTTRMAASTTEYYGVRGGDLIAVISST